MNLYHYLILWYQPRLDEDAAEPFAVVAEKNDRDERSIFCIGKYLRGDETTIGGRLVSNFKNVLIERMEAAAVSCTGRELVIGKLRSEFSGNIYAHGPDTQQSPLNLPRVTYELFAQHVDLPPEALVRLHDEHIEPVRVRDQYAIGPLALPY
jgi:hypothetical protein